jgi:hypothetical protein
MMVTIVGLLLFGLGMSPEAARLATAPAAQDEPAMVTMAIQVTDGTGAALGGVDVRATGPVEREGRTSEQGGIAFTNLKEGTYRLRFTRQGYSTLERLVTVQAGRPAPVVVEVMLSGALPLPAVSMSDPTRGARPLQPLPRIAEPKTVAIQSFVDRNFISQAQERKDSPLGCAGTGTATLLQLREKFLREVHETTDKWLYVVAGEGVLLVGDIEEPLAAGTFSLVPRTIEHWIVPSGRNPLILISILTGQPCLQP